MKNRSSLLVFYLLTVLCVMPLTVNADFDLGGKVSYSGPRVHSAGTAWSEALQRALQRAINRDDYICSAPTALDLWLYDQVDQIDPWTLDVLFALSVFNWSIDAKLIADHDAEGEYIGVDGEYTQRQIKTFKDNKRFWDIYSDDILLMGGHGAEIADDELMYAFLPVAFGNPPLFVQDILLNAARSAIEGGLVDLTFFDPNVYFVSPGIPGGYDNPLLSFNAVAFSAFGGEIFPGSGIIPDKVVMGDGLPAAFTSIGIGYKEGPDQILSHEFAHHVQFENGAISPVPVSPEATRRAELMADGFAAYYNSHARGNSFQPKRFADVMASAYEVGDCSFENINHHGTHLQRLKAAIWGQWVSDSAPDQGHIYASSLMVEMFDEALPAIVAPDAP